MERDLKLMEIILYQAQLFQNGLWDWMGGITSSWEASVFSFADMGSALSAASEFSV